MPVNIVSEEDALQLAEAYLLALCNANWRYIEFDDRWNELRYLFVCAWRQFPTNTGRFLLDFERVCRPYMDELNRKACARWYRERSMDGMRFGSHSTDGGGEFSLHQVLSAEEDSTKLHVDAFLHSLVARDRKILEALLRGCSKAEIARTYGMSTYQLSRLLHTLGQHYLTRYRS